VYYSGWDRSGTSPDSVTGIHHPSGDVKKICQYINSPTQTDFNAGNGSAACWKIPDWTFGVTEGGSSGSALFSENHHIVGHLYGGLAACIGTSDNNSEDYYGRFDVSWTGEGSNSTRLQNWLDPTETHLIQIDGYDPNLPINDLDASITSISGLDSKYCDSSTININLTLRNGGRSTLTTALIVYGIDLNTIDTVFWSGSLDSTLEEAVVLSGISIDLGEHTFWAKVSNPNNLTDENLSNDSVSFSYAQFNGGKFTMDLLFDCYPEETSWRLLNDEGFLISEGKNFDASNSDGQILTEWCLAEGCYTFTLSDEGEDGIDGKSRYGCGQNGTFTILDSIGNTVAELFRDDFGSSTEESFCVVLPKLEDYDICDLINIFPIPSSEELMISLQSPIPEEEYSLKLYNNLGQLIISEETNDQSITLNTSTLPQGSYNLQFTSSSWSADKRIMIIR
jgi:hypothetical protein